MATDISTDEHGSLTRGRKFTAPELYLMALALLEKGPCHGYEIIKELKAVSLGFYSPSPGVLYPVLGRMLRQGHATAEAEGKRKRYVLSDSGRQYLEGRAASAERLFARLRHAAKKMLWISQGMDPEAAAQATGWLPEFVEARRALRSALLARSDADHYEQRRLVAILKRAVAEIEQNLNLISKSEHSMNETDLTVQKLRHPLKLRMLRVSRITELTPSMRRITLTGPDLEGFHSPSFDDHVKLFFPAEPGAELVLPSLGPDGPQHADESRRPIARDYTPRRFNAAAQELDVDFVLHHSGPATDWALRASVGDALGVGGPRGSFVIPTGFDWHLLIGDETAMPAIGRRLEELPQGAQALVLIKTRDASSRLEFQTRCDARIQWLVEDASGPSGGMDALERALRALDLPEGEGYVWAAGEYTPIQKVREHLVKERGVDKSRIRAASYWRREAPATHVNFE